MSGRQGDRAPRDDGLLSSKHDSNVSFSVAAESFGGVRAPCEVLVWFKRYSAHEMFNEEPGRMLAALLCHTRPLAEKAGDVAPRSAGSRAYAFSRAPMRGRRRRHSTVHHSHFSVDLVSTSSKAT